VVACEEVEDLHIFHNQLVVDNAQAFVLHWESGVVEVDGDEVAEGCLDCILLHAQMTKVPYNVAEEVDEKAVEVHMGEVLLVLDR